MPDIWEIDEVTLEAELVDDYQEVDDSFWEDQQFLRNFDLEGWD